MTIKVLLKRKVSKEKYGKLKALLNELRSATTGQPGYINGETLKRVDDIGECLVISKWKSRGDWNRWFERPERAVIHEKIDELLGSPTVYEIFEYD